MPGHHPGAWRLSRGVTLGGGVGGGCPGASPRAGRLSRTVTLGGEAAPGVTQGGGRLSRGVTLGAGAVPGRHPGRGRLSLAPARLGPPAASALLRDVSLLTSGARDRQEPPYPAPGARLGLLPLRGEASAPRLLAAEPQARPHSPGAPPLAGSSALPGGARSSGDALGARSPALGCPGGRGRPPEPRGRLTCLRESGPGSLAFVCTTLGGCPASFTFTAPAPTGLPSADLRDASRALLFPRVPSQPAPWPPPGQGPRPGSSLRMVTLLTAQWAKARTEKAGARGESGERLVEEAGRAGETPGPPSPRRSAEGRAPEPHGGWSWQVDPLFPPALCPGACLPAGPQRPHT